MSDRYIEKSFLYLLALSLLLHVGAFALFYYLPQTIQPPPEEPVMMDLQDLTVPEQQPKPVQNKPQQAVEQSNKLPKIEPEKIEVKQEVMKDKKNYYVPPKGQQMPSGTGKSSQSAPSRTVERQPQHIESGTSVSGLLKPKKEQEITRFQDKFSIKQSTSKNIEERIKNKLGKENGGGGFEFSDEIDASLVGFVRRFENQVSSNLIYPPQERLHGLEGKGIGEVTYNRKGEIVEILFTRSGGKAFDESVVNALKMTPVGPLPRAYTKDSVTIPFVYGFRLPPQPPK